jgi:hypothetical protein
MLAKWDPFHDINGVRTVSVPKVEAAKPRAIEVKSK